MVESERTEEGPPKEKEDGMGNLLLLSQCASGLGVFFLGLAALWFVSVYMTKEK